MTAVGVMVSCRCFREFDVPPRYLKKGNELALGKYIAKLIDEEGEPSGNLWTPESFADKTDIHLTDQALDVVEKNGKVVSVE